MSAVSEEDVLAALLILWLEGQGDLHDVPDDARGVPVAVGWLAWDRACPTVNPQTIERAIADSERRWEVERCEREVLDAVEAWDGSMLPGHAAVRLRAANAKLRHARMVLAHAR